MLLIVDPDWCGRRRRRSLIAALPPDEVVGLLQARLGALEVLRTEAQRVRDQALAQGVHPLFLIEEAYRVALLDTDAAFTRRFIDQIRDPEDGWAADCRRHRDAFAEHPRTADTD